MIRKSVGILCATAALALGGALGMVAPDASAADWPTKPVRFVVPYAPGGGTDIMTRVLLPHLSSRLGQPVIVENKSGAGSTIGTEQVVESDPDGYTFLVVDTAITVNPFLYKKLPYDTLKDLQPVSLLATAPVILVVHPKVPAKSVKELIDLAKAKPGQLNFASGGNGASTHLAVELLESVAGIDMVHVPYKGTGPAVTDLVGGHVDLLMGGISSARSHVEAGRLRALAVTGEKRSPAMPDVPTFKELGLAGVNASSYWGVLAPAGTPKPIVDRLSKEIAAALQVPEVGKRLVELGYDVIGGSPEDYGRNLRAEMEKWGPVIKKSGVRID